jgi:hypothetical protein
MAREFPAAPPIGIIAYSDFYDLPEQRVWGDYWFKENLIREFSRTGYPSTTDRRKSFCTFGEPRPIFLQTPTTSSGSTATLTGSMRIYWENTRRSIAYRATSYRN